MKNEIIAVTVLLVSAFFLMYSADFFSQGSQVETVNNFTGDTSVQSLTVSDGKPVYVTLSDYETYPYYKGEVYGKEFESTGFASLINDQVVFTAEKDGRDFLVIDGDIKVNSTENLKEPEILEGRPVYVEGDENLTLKHGQQELRDFQEVETVKVINGSIAVIASKDHDRYLWYNGSVIDRNVSTTDLKEYRGKPIYEKYESSDYSLGYSLGLEGEKLELNGTVDDFRVIDGKLLVSFENDRKVLGEENISYCGRIEQVDIVEEKIACPGPNRTKIFYGDETKGTGYDKVMTPFEYEDSLGFIANKNGASFIVSGEKTLTGNYSVIYDAFTYNDSLYYSGARKGKINVYRNNKKVTDYPIASFLEKQDHKDKPLITVQDSNQTIYRGREPLKTAEWIERPIKSEEGITYQYYDDGETVLVTPEKDISGYRYVQDYRYGEKGLAYLTHQKLRHFLVYNNRKSMNFTETADIRLVNGTPYFIGAKNGHKLLMKGLDLYKNLSSSDYSYSQLIDEEEKEYETLEDKNGKYIRIEGEKHGPFPKVPDSTYYPYFDEVTYRNGSVALIENRKDTDFLYYEGNRYGPYNYIPEYELLDERIFFTVMGKNSFGVKKIEK